MQLSSATWMLRGNRTRAEAADAVAIARRLYESVRALVAEGKTGEPDGDNEQ